MLVRLWYNMAGKCCLTGSRCGRFAAETGNSVVILGSLCTGPRPKHEGGRASDGHGETDSE